MTHLFSSEGRINRLEFNLTYFPICFGINFLNAVFPIETTAGLIIYLLIWLPAMWIIFAQGAKRCHDLGHSGWFQLIPFYLIVMVFTGGDSTTNRYGAVTW